MKSTLSVGEFENYPFKHISLSQNFFAPLQTPFPGALEGQNLISWRWSLPSPADPVWWRSIHAISNYHGNRPTNRTYYNTLCRS